MILAGWAHLCLQSNKMSYVQRNGYPTGFGGACVTSFLHCVFYVLSYIGCMKVPVGQPFCYLRSTLLCLPAIGVSCTYCDWFPHLHCTQFCLIIDARCAVSCSNVQEGACMFTRWADVGSSHFNRAGTSHAATAQLCLAIFLLSSSAWKSTWGIDVFSANEIVWANWNMAGYGMGDMHSHMWHNWRGGEHDLKGNEQLWAQNATISCTACSKEMGGRAITVTKQRVCCRSRPSWNIIFKDGDNLIMRDSITTLHEKLRMAPDPVDTVSCIWIVSVKRSVHNVYHYNVYHKSFVQSVYLLVLVCPGHLMKML